MTAIGSAGGALTGGAPRARNDPMIAGSHGSLALEVPR
jgi:hypothetical protein